MADSENNKPKTEKTSASVTSTLPRLCQNNIFYLKDSSCNIPKLKSRFQGIQGNNAILDEKHKCKGGKENSQINFEDLKLIEFEQSDQKLSGEDHLLFQNPLKNYHGQIPVRYRHSLNLLRMSPIATRSPSPIKKASPKDKPSNKVKVITLEQETKKKRHTDSSRSPSPLKTAIHNMKSKSRTHSLTPATEGNANLEKTGEIKSHDTKRPTNVKSNTKSKKSKDKSSKDQSKNSNISKQISQPSLPVKEKIQPQEKISLDHLKSEVYSGDHTRLSFEKVHLCIEKSMDNLALKEKKRRYFVTYSSEDARKKAEASVSLLKNISSTSITAYSTESDKRKKLVQHSNIKSMSGHELILTPSVKLDIEKGDVGPEDLEITDFLQEREDNFGNQKVIIPQDDTNEYDTEVSTDGEMTIRGVSIPSPRPLETKNNDLNRKNALWKSREAELLSDVDYRQSVYHPAVSRRHKKDNDDVEYGVKTQSQEDDLNEMNKQSYEGRSHSSIGRNRYSSSSSKQISSCSSESPWISSFDRIDEKPMYNSVIPAGSFYGVKKSRTKKEKVSGALLHFTLKVIRLLAIFNLWPGDNCHMLTSQSLRLAS